MKYLARLNPFLAALFPVLFLYSRNVDEVPFMTAAAVMLAVLVGSAIFTSIVWLGMRNEARAGFLATAWLFLFFFYGHIYELIEGASIAGFVVGRQRFLLAAEVFAALAIVLVTIRYQAVCQKTTPYITIALVILIVINAGSLGINLLRSSEAVAAGGIGIHEVSLPAKPPEELPDIYYIILDSYPREDILNATFGFDNSEFLDYLRRNNFFIASESRSNYVQTSLSLSSALNMEYLDQLLPHLEQSSTNISSLRDAIRDNNAALLAKRMGYKFAFLHSPWGPTLANPHADVELPGDGYPLGAIGRVLVQPILGNDFGFALFRTTIMRGFMDAWFVLFAADLFSNNVGHLKRIADIQGPTFTFAHFIPPHPPYLFDQEGNTRNFIYYFESFGDKESYIDQLIWVNKSMTEAIDYILDKNKEGSVIILQGDHGTGFSDTQRTITIGGQPEDIVIHERTSILNVYHLPDMCEPVGLNKSITPVNTFRLIFDSCWGTEFGLLEDQAYWSSYEAPYDLTPIE